MKYAAAAIALALTPTAFADTLPVNSGRPPIQVPTGVEVKGSTDYVIENDSKVRQVRNGSREKILSDMTKETMNPSGNDG